MKTVLGSQMSILCQQQAKDRFVHRYTRDHIPSWARGTDNRVQFDSDADWLAHTYFCVLDSGKRLSDRHSYCRANPTWPDNPELRRDCA